MMAKKTYVVSHPKLCLNVKLDGEKTAKLQKVPVGTEVSLEEAVAKNLVESGKLTAKSTKKAATAE